MILFFQYPVGEKVTLVSIQRFKVPLTYSRNVRHKQYPMNFLFDPSGKIIAKKLTPDRLEEKLKIILK
jgi:hypothetical protein